MHGVPLDQLLDGIDGLLVERFGPAAPLVNGVAILDPDDDSRDHHDELVLVIGVRGRESVPVLRAAARSGASVVAVKDSAAARGSAGSLANLDSGVALLVVRPAVRWDQLVMLLRERLDAAELQHHPVRPGPIGIGNDLFALAEDTALATGGIVTIEDAGNRVLAYSRSDDDVDELRRLSILGWQGPEPYLRMLREWGVFDRLRAGEQVVHVEEHPEIGIRARLAVGIRAGNRYLGTIWVQQRGARVAPRAEEALVGAARLAAAEILRRRTGSALGRGSRQDLLTGRASPDLVAGRLGLDPNTAALVVGFGAQVSPDASARELHREQALGLVAVYATAHHRHALVGLVGDRVYAVLPGDRTCPPAQAGVLSWVRHAVEMLRARTGNDVCTGIGLPARELSGVAEARSEADRVLDALLRRGGGHSGGGQSVATIGELRSEVLLAEALDLLAGRPELGHPGVAALAAHDAERGGELVSSVMTYLDSLGDVSAAAAALNVHPNTLRYRLRRARKLSGIDLDDPSERLACHLQLLLVSRRAAPGS
ncbi:MAG: helix-turn-helix domain-containing protein [Actinomycetota bacterium]|nr:helix-turn-helix domain-containing protein [Actinomycetota bacterium]